jgi:hypothetical protein
MKTVCQYTHFARYAQSMLATEAFGTSLNSRLI